MKKAIIVGATSGIGREIARRLLSKGWMVAATGRRLERLEELRKEFGEERTLIARMDVMDEGCTAVLDALIEKMGAPDLLFYASGVGLQNRELDEEKEILTVRTNGEGMVRLVISFLKYVRDSGEYSKDHKAHIAVITSVAGTAGIGTAAAYSATKRMQMTYISALAQLSHMEKIPVDFTDIRPGFVKTDILNPNKHYPMLMSLEDAGNYIEKGLERRKRILIFDWRFRLLVSFWNLIPRCLWERISFIKN